VVSPLFGDLTGVGPVLVFSGTDEILNADAHPLVDALLASWLWARLGSGHVTPRLPPAGRIGHESAWHAGALRPV
jgi:hypothetical protein